MSLTETQKYLIGNKTFMKNSADLTTLCLTKSKNNINFTCKIVKLYTRFIHDHFEENPQFTDMMKQLLMERMNGDWWIEKLVVLKSL